MSCSLYRYTEACEGRECLGDCDLCNFYPDDEDYIEIEIEIEDE
jgi:hypothetical protein